MNKTVMKQGKYKKKQSNLIVLNLKGPGDITFK